MRIVETGRGRAGFVSLRPLSPWLIPAGDEVGLLRASEPLAIIGDIHGRADLLEAMVARLKNEAPGARPVFVGDYIDRGRESRRVLELVRDMTAKGAVALMGNHERMMLDFLAEPRSGFHWLANGGIETLASFAVELPRQPQAGEIERARDQLEAALVAEGMLEWLAERPLLWRSGNVVAVHAMVDPQRPLAEQGEHDLLWRRPGPADPPHIEGVWVIHGHTVMSAPTIQPGYVRIDIGAWRTGNLCAAIIGDRQADEVLFRM